MVMNGVRCDVFVAAKGKRVRCSCLVVEISLRQHVLKSLAYERVAAVCTRSSCHLASNSHRGMSTALIDACVVIYTVAMVRVQSSSNGVRLFTALQHVRQKAKLANSQTVPPQPSSNPLTTQTRSTISLPNHGDNLNLTAQ